MRLGLPGQPLLLAMVIAGVAVAAVGLGVGDRLADGLRIAPGALAAALLAPAVALPALLWHAARARRRRRRQEWRLLQATYTLRQDVALIERLASVDSLTGLLNHRAWHERLREEWSRALRYGTAPAVIMLDLDYFKGINDRYGHEAGDDVLRALARVLQRLRSTDLVGRLGGDEFCILLPDSSSAEAWLVAEKTRAALAQEVAAILGRSGGRVSLSAGVASGREVAAGDAKALLRAADRALYDAKAAGGDCVRVARSGEIPEQRAA